MPGIAILGLENAQRGAASGLPPDASLAHARRLFFQKAAPPRPALRCACVKPKAPLNGEFFLAERALFS